MKTRSDKAMSTSVKKETCIWPMATSALALTMLGAAVGISAGGAPLAAQVAKVSAQPAVQAVAPALFSVPPEGRGVAQASTVLDLAAHGYVEKEFLAKGTANRYRTIDPVKTAELVDGGHPYTTRILVRRPVDPAKFNGIVIVEWLNVTGQQDVDAMFAPLRDHLLAKGYAWVGVSAQLAGTRALLNMDPVRYAGVSLAASNVDPVTRDMSQMKDAASRAAVPLPKSGELDSTGDVLSWDALTQITVGLRHPGSVNPLGGLKPRLFIAAGFSQSSSRLNQYYNMIQPFYPGLFDGYLLADRAKPLRTDMRTKVASVGTESFWGRSDTMHAPPPDSANLRVWEVAGASHNSYGDMVDYFDPLFKKMRLAGGLNRTSTAASSMGCAITPRFSRVRYGGILSAQLEALVKWITRGVPPAAAPRFVADANGGLFRDKEGRVKGGVRIADYDAPIAHSAGINTGPGLCRLYGYHTDFTPAQLCERYGSSAGYVAKVTAVTRRAQRQGFLLKADADRTIEEAKQVPVSCGAKDKLPS